MLVQRNWIFIVLTNWSGIGGTAAALMLLPLAEGQNCIYHLSQPRGVELDGRQAILA